MAFLDISRRSNLEEGLGKHPARKPTFLGDPDGGGQCIGSAGPSSPEALGLTRSQPLHKGKLLLRVVPDALISNPFGTS